MNTMTATVARPAAPPAISARWLGLSVVLAATIMNLLDSTVVNVAAPSIYADLGGGLAALQWIAAGYTLALAVGLLTGGRLGDMYGRKRMLMIGVAGFTVTSLACALAWSPGVLVGSRVLQGLFAAIMIPQCFGLIRDLFPPQDIGKAFAAFGPVIGLSTVIGPIVAGFLVAGTGWRMIFLINLPLGVWAIVTGRRILPDNAPTHRSARLDVPGMLLAGAAMFLLVYPLVQGRELGWPAWTFVMLAASVVVFAVFVAYQLRLKGRTPLVELSVFTKRSFSSGVIFVIVFFGAIVGFSLAVGLFLQLGLGYSVIRASLTMSAWALGAFLGSGFAAAMMSKLGRRILHIGLIGMAIGMSGVYLVLQGSGIDLTSWELAVPLGAFGFGMGMIFVPLFGIIMGEISDHEVGSASSSLEALQQLGASLGVAVLGTIFFGITGPAIAATTSVRAASVVTLIALGLTAVAFGLGFLLPHKARAEA
jgi:EmrB/QacA subfamily drug resistance transporter